MKNITLQLKTIAVILPVNNPEILSQADLDSYQTDDCYFKLSYVNTPLKELNTVIDAVKVVPLVLEKMVEAEKSGASAVIVYAFGDVGIKEGKALVSIPVMGLGKVASHMAALLCRKRFTILPGMLAHNAFIEEMIFDESLERKFIPASYAPEVSPMQIRTDANLLQKLMGCASKEITENKVDTFTLGCGSFIGVAKKLELALREKFKLPIIVIDPVEVPFNVVKALV